MPARIVPGIGLTSFWDYGDTSWKTGMDENLWRLSLLVQPHFQGFVTEEPETGTQGQIFITSGGGYPDHVLVYDDGAWFYIPPFTGMTFFNVNEYMTYLYISGEGWKNVSSPEHYKEMYEANADTNAFTDAFMTKLEGIEDGATGDMTPAEVKLAYESNPDTNAFTDNDKARLNSLASSRFLGVYATATALRAAHPSPAIGSFAYVDLGVGFDIAVYIWDATDNDYVLQSGANSMETPESIMAKYEANDDRNGFTDAEKNKLANMPDVFPAPLSAEQIKELYESNPDRNGFSDDEKLKLLSVEENATADMTAEEIRDQYESNDNRNAFTDALLEKLNGIETGATADLSAGEIKTLYESNADTNVFTDAEKTKLAGLSSPLFLGSFVSLAALVSAHPSPAAGSYAYVDAGIGENVLQYIWDTTDSQYVTQISGGTETPESIKSKYESNADTNAFTNAEKTKLTGIEAGAEVNLTGSGLVTAIDTALGSTDWQGGSVPAPVTLTINTYTASRTMDAADISAYVRMNMATAGTFTVVNNSTLAVDVGTVIQVRAVGAGPISIAAAVGVTILTAETLNLRKQGSTASLIKVASNTWELTGDLELQV